MLIKESGIQDIRDSEAFNYSDGDKTHRHSGAINSVTGSADAGAASAAPANKTDETSAGSAPHNAPHRRCRHDQDVSGGGEKSQDRGSCCDSNRQWRQNFDDSQWD